MEGFTFIERLGSIALVDKSMEYVGSQYIKFKSANERIGTLISGAEDSVLRVAQAAFHFTKKILPYERLDKIACASLDKAENYWKWNKKDVKVCTDTPVQTELETNIVSTFAHNTIDKMEYVVDYVLPPASPESPSAKTETRFLQRLSCLGLQTKKRIVETGKRAAALKGEQLPDNLTVSHMTNSFRHILSNSYQHLQNQPEAEGTIRKPLRFIALTSVGMTLSVMGAAEATLPRVSDTSALAFTKAKAAGHATSELANGFVSKIYTNAQRNGTAIFSRAKRQEKMATQLGNSPAWISFSGASETNSSQDFSPLEKDPDVVSRCE